MNPDIGIRDVRDESYSQPGTNRLKSGHQQSVSNVNLVVKEEDHDGGDAESENNQELDAISSTEAVFANQYQAGKQKDADSGLNKAPIHANQEKNEERQRAFKLLLIHSRFLDPAFRIYK